MKKVLAIADVHGRTDWEDICKHALKHKFDIVFLGDYVDSFTVNPYVIYSNLSNIIKFKKENPYNVHLLLGNHDYAYIFHQHQTSGYSIGMADSYRELLNGNINLFDVAYGYRAKDKYYLFTHAGVVDLWWEHCVLSSVKTDGSLLSRLTDGNIDGMEIHEVLNLCRDQKYILWRVGPGRHGSSLPSCIWADFEDLLINPYPNITQVVGHTGSCNNMFSNVDGNNLICLDSGRRLGYMHFVLDIENE